MFTAGLFGENYLFDLHFDLVRQFEAVGGEDFDPVVGGGIVAGGDHDAAGGAHRFGEVGHRGGRHRTDREDIHPHAEKAAGDGVLQHVAGDPGVFAEHDPPATGAAVGAEHLCRALADQQRQFRRDWVTVRLAADSVGSEQFFHR